MIFIQNKYTTIYFTIITKAKETIHHTTTYTEKHHIIPKSLGGSNDKTNLVVLTAREHFICHWLLTKMTKGQAYGSMVYALRRMRSEAKHQPRYNTKITARVYATLKSEYAKVASIMMKGKNSSKVRTPEVRANMSLARKGKSKSAEHKRKMSISAMGKIKTEEHKENIKKNHHDCKGANNSAAKTWKITNPHGEEFTIVGALKPFCKQHNISHGIMWLVANKGLVPTEKSMCYNWKCEVV